MTNQNRAITLALAAALACIVPAGTLRADPAEGGNASCAGYEAANVSPPGTLSGPFSQFGMPGILAFIDVVIETVGLDNRGEVIRVLSHFHEGSHEGCDAAVGVPPGTE